MADANGNNFTPWKPIVRKGVFKSTGTSDYDMIRTNRTPSPIVEMPMSPQVTANRNQNPLSPRLTIVDCPLSPPILPPIILVRNIHEIPIERVEEVRSAIGNLKQWV